MAAKSFKNLLQELCQKKGCDLPMYSTTGTQEEWKSKVCVMDKLFTDEQIFRRKKDAEEDIAQLAYENLFITTDYKLSFTREKGVNLALFFDVENQPNVMREFLQTIYTEHVSKYIFCSQHYNIDAVVPDILDCGLVQVPSSGRDAADLGMTLFIGSLMDRQRYEKYILVTQDKFGAVVAECIKHGKQISPTYKNVDAVVCGDFPRLIEEIESFYK